MSFKPFSSIIHQLFALLSYPLVSILGKGGILLLVYRLLKSQIRKRSLENASVILLLLRTLLLFIGALLLLDEFEPMKPMVQKIVASSGLMAVVVGIAAQETLGNVFSGLMIIFCRPYQIGDLIKVNQGELIGYVEAIRFRDTVIRTYESNRVLVPNSKMNTATIENADFATAEKDNYLEIPVAYSADVQHVRKVLESILIENFEGILDKVPEIRLIRFDNSNFVYRIVVPSKDSLEGFSICCTLREKIAERFQKENISFGSSFIDFEADFKQIIQRQDE